MAEVLQISIVMPAFNAEKTIAESIESVQKQTYLYWELLVLDDASTDRTREVVEKMSASDSRIHLYTEDENHGVAFERNKGVQKAHYDWIAFLDSDDCWTEDKLEKQVHQVQLDSMSNAPSLYYTGSAFMNASGQRLPYILHVPSRLSTSDILKQNLISCSSVLIKKKLILKHPMPISERKPIHEDFATWITILKEGDAVGIDEPLLIYRVSSNSKSGNKLKSAMMHWNSMRMNEVSISASLYNMFFYIARGLRKYHSILKQ